MSSLAMSMGIELSATSSLRAVFHAAVMWMRPWCSLASTSYAWKQLYLAASLVCSASVVHLHEGSVPGCTAVCSSHRLAISSIQPTSGTRCAEELCTAVSPPATGPHPREECGAGCRCHPREFPHLIQIISTLQQGWWLLRQADMPGIFFILPCSSCL